MDKFALIEQKHFMHHRIGIPREMTIHSLWTCLRDMNHLSKYHLGKGNIPAKDELKSIFVHAMPRWMQHSMEVENFHWYTKPTQEVVNYLLRLLLIHTMVEAGKRN